MNGELNADEARDLIEALRRLYPDPDKTPEETKAEAALVPSPIRVDGAEFERFRAAEIWQEMRGLPLALQKQRVRLYRFQSSAFFDLLREASRREGRSDRQRGIALAELALESLADSDEVFGDRIHDLRALGWAWLGNAQALDLDFSAADLALSKAEKEWLKPRALQDSSVLAAICNFKGKLRMFQRRYAESLKLVRRSRTLFRHSFDKAGEARALVLMAATLAYSGDLPAAIDALNESRDLVIDQGNSIMLFAIATNLANAYARLGDLQAAELNLIRARAHLETLDYPMGRYEVQWVEADIRSGRGDFAAAEETYLAARSGYIGSEDLCSVGLLSLDLALLNALHGCWEEVRKLTSEAITILTGLQLHTETVAALDLLAGSVALDELSAELLGEVRSKLQHDPWARLARPARTEEIYPGSGAQT